MRQRNTVAAREPSRTVVWFVRVAGTVGFLVWFSFRSLWMEYAYTRPTSMQPTLGRQYELDTHGHVVYLTHNEVLILHTLGESGMGFMIVAALVGLAAKHRLRRRD